jgi:thioredoxin-related protein
MNHLKLLILSISLTSIFACNNQSSEQNKIVKSEASQIKANHLEVFCFHGTRQCTTCKNMKANTKKTLDTHFKNQLNDSSITFQIIDVDLEENAVIAEKFEATGTALMLNKVVNGKDSIIDLSDFVFEKANDEAQFIPELTAIINGLIQK